MQQLVFILHVLVAVGLIVLVLLHHGKGADTGASFGSGASQTIFGSVGSMPFFTKVAAVLAVTFFITSLLLGYFIAHQPQQEAVLPDDTVQVALPQSSVAVLPSEATKNIETSSPVDTEKSQPGNKIVKVDAQKPHSAKN